MCEWKNEQIIETNKFNRLLELESHKHNGEVQLS